jgi:hypothetical protein
VYQNCALGVQANFFSCTVPTKEQKFTKMFHLLLSRNVLAILLSIATLSYLPKARSDYAPSNYNDCDFESVTLLYSNKTLLDASTNFGTYTISLCNNTSANNTICTMKQQASDATTAEQVNVTIDFTALYEDSVFMEYAVACKMSGGGLCAMSIATTCEDSFKLGLDVIGYPSCFAASCNNIDIEELIKEYTENFLTDALSISADLINSTNLVTELIC